MKKVKVGIIGTGNIGTDILIKLKRSTILECGLFTGRNVYSEGIRIAEKMRVPTSAASINAILENPECCEIVFDATSAMSHMSHAPLLKELNKFVIDLTPAKIGKMCVPVLNLSDCLKKNNVNLITCGGQATIPIACAINEIHPDIEYIEIAASISSKSAGKGTRNNIDKFTQTTRDALKSFTQTKRTKALIILNSADPPVNMRNTIYALIKNPDMEKIRQNVRRMEERIKKYVPGYRLLYDPVFEDGCVIIGIEVVGLGDYLPSYAGNLDIITCAAIEVAEAYAQKILQGEDR